MYVIITERIVRVGQFKITDILSVIFAIVIIVVTNCYFCNAVNRRCGNGGFKYVNQQLAVGWST